MAVSSTMLPLGTAAPDFSLTDTVSGTTISLGDLTGNVVVVMFICNHCPYVKHVRRGLVALGEEYDGTDVDIVAIGSNDPATHPDDSAEELGRIARESGYRFPVLFDGTQEVARAYTAACTPDFFVFDGERALAYRGQFDSSRPGTDIPVTGEDLRGAIEALRAGVAPAADQRPSIGCSIKWRPGTEPGYAS